MWIDTGQMQVGKQNIITEILILGLQRLLDLDDEFRVPGRFRVNDSGTNGFIGLVCETGTNTGIFFNTDFMSLTDQLFRAMRCEGNTVFPVLGFLDDTYLHNQIRPISFGTFWLSG